MSERERSDEHELSDDELAQESAMGLPDREAMSLIGGPVPTDLMIIPTPEPYWDTMPVEEPTPLADNGDLTGAD